VSDVPAPGVDPDWFPYAVMGAVWNQAGTERTELGQLLARAKDDHDEVAIATLSERFVEWGSIWADPGDALVIPVPASPDRPNVLVERMAAGLAQRWGVTTETFLVRHNVTPRMRDIAPADRAALARAAGYETTGSLVGASVMLVDDVMVTGATLHQVARVLQAAGVSSLQALVLARSQRRDMA